MPRVLQRNLSRAAEASVYLLAVIASVSLVGCRDAPPKAAGPARPQAVRTTTPRVGPVRDAVRFVGTVRAAREVQVTAQIAGTLADLPVPEGGHARAGAILARVATPDVAARLARADAEIQRATVERDHACRTLEIDAKLAKTGDVPKEKVEAARRACDAGAAAVNAGEATRAEILAALGRSVERAPFEGQVLRTLVERGQSVGPGRPILEYGDRARELRVLVAETDVRRGVRPGMPALVTLPSGEPARRTVSAVSASASPQTRAVEVTVALEPDDAAGVPVGTTLEVALVLAEEESATSVPRRAIKETPAGDFLFVVEGGRASELPVTVGLEEGGWVAVSPSLPEDAEVVVRGAHRLDPTKPVFAVKDEVQP